MSQPPIADPIMLDKDAIAMEKASTSYQSSDVVEDDVFGKIEGNSVNYRDVSLIAVNGISSSCCLQVGWMGSAIGKSRSKKHSLKPAHRFQSYAQDSNRVGSIEYSIRAINVSSCSDTSGLAYSPQRLGIVGGLIALLAVAVITTWADYVVGQFKLKHKEICVLILSSHFL